MAQARIPRRKIAVYFAGELLKGKDITKQLAAYLVESKRTKEVSLLVRDIEAALLDRGVLYADVASSHKLSDDTLKSVTSYLQKSTSAKEVHLRTSIDETLLGGVKIDTPDRQLDNTIRHKLNQLTASKL